MSGLKAVHTPSVPRPAEIIDGIIIHALEHLFPFILPEVKSSLKD
jgi:hypothetical protein